MLSSYGGLLTNAMSSWRNTLIKLRHYDETKKGFMKLCLNSLNLTLEKHSVNMPRTHCQKAGISTMAHELACIF